MIELYGGDLYIADPWPAIYIKSMDALVYADLHLGIEGTLLEEGISIPRRVSQATIDMVLRGIDDYNASTIILNGDVKHGFGLLNTSEWMTLKILFEELSGRGLNVIIVRGNHDNYLGILADKYGFKFVERIDEGIYSILHGHISYSWDELNNVVIIGHEHPSITLRDEVGIKYKFKSFLWGEYRGHKLLILPSVGELATGSTINIYSGDELLSPLVKGIDLSSFKPYAIIPGEIVKEFPPLRELDALL